SVTIGQLKYEIISSSERKVSVSAANHDGCSGDITIPPTVEIEGITYTVKCIGYKAFFDCDSLKSVTIPYTVWSIGDYAFKDCSAMVTVSIPNTVTSIGEGAFVDCSDLTSVYYDSENPLEVSSNIFSNYDNLTLYVPERAVEKCKQINPWKKFSKIKAFTFSDIEDNSQLEYEIISSSERTVSVSANSIECTGDITIPSTVKINGITYTVTSIVDGAFRGCSALTSVKVPKTISYIGLSAFSKCGGLESIYVDKNNKNYTDIDGVLYNKNMTELIQCPGGMKSVTIPTSVISINDEAFYGCESLISVSIPNSVSYIGMSAFYGCGAMTSVDIPTSVTSIGNEAFLFCSSLTSVKIPNSVTSIGNEAFGFCSSLTSVKIPDSVTSIGNEAFGFCSSLTSVKIPDSVTSISEDAFFECSALTSVKIPNSVISIGEKAFSNCTALTSVNIPSSVSAISYDAFYGCGSLKSIYVDKRNKYYSDVDGVLYNKGATELIQCPGGLKSVIIPKSVISIGDQAFQGCRNLVSVTIPNSVKTIGYGAFRGCHALNSATIPNSVTSIGKIAFESCVSLTSVNIPSSITEIGYGAFGKCRSLISVYYGAENPIEGYSDIFSSYDNLTLYVPENAVEKCKHINPWKKFPKIRAYDFAGAK
ncbi:MAG: leucine-rich repeat domain-containing protein, partial [Muribaculaceae bacterium]|nr:leucine-rich repeat domain-containing protein [Muribaculaceae bacterium]